MLAMKEEYLPHYTYDDYALWEGDWELVDGIAYAMSPAPTIEHQEINGNIFLALRDAMKACKKCKAISEIDWKTTEDTVVQPDTLVVCNLKNKGAYLSQSPEIIFEVLSPSTKKKDRNLKYHLYASEGVKYYIMVDPAGMFAEVYKLDGAIYRLEGEFKTENYTFDIEECSFDFSFEEVFDID
jgi:Uma2 family endonuclease